MIDLGNKFLFEMKTVYRVICIQFLNSKSFVASYSNQTQWKKYVASILFFQLHVKMCMNLSGGKSQKTEMVPKVETHFTSNFMVAVSCRCFFGLFSRWNTILQLPLLLLCCKYWYHCIFILGNNVVCKVSFE